MPAPEYRCILRQLFEVLCLRDYFGSGQFNMLSVICFIKCCMCVNYEPGNHALFVADLLLTLRT